MKVGVTSLTTAMLAAAAFRAVAAGGVDGTPAEGAAPATMEG